jgi:hypothetical protein
LPECRLVLLVLVLLVLVQRQRQRRQLLVVRGHAKGHGRWHGRQLLNHGPGRVWEERQLPSGRVQQAQVLLPCARESRLLYAGVLPYRGWGMGVLLCHWWIAGCWGRIT